MKIGIVDVGGGFRRIYACGVLDYYLDENIQFDLGIGVSTGSANIASFIVGQRGRNYLVYTKYGLRKQRENRIKNLTASLMPRQLAAGYLRSPVSY